MFSVRIESGSTFPRRAGFQQPVNVFALTTGDAVERKDVGALTDFLHRRTTQASRHHGQSPVAVCDKTGTYPHAGRKA
jgi:hypothetical protein